MKRRDALDRLLNNAALAPVEERAELSFPTQARTLAAWRRAGPQPEAVLPVLRKAIVAALAITALTVAFTVATAHNNDAADVDEIVSATNSLNDAVDLVWTE
jgi:hypothetical protein